MVHGFYLVAWGFGSNSCDSLVLVMFGIGEILDWNPLRSTNVVG